MDLGFGTAVMFPFLLFNAFTKRPIATVSFPRPTWPSFAPASLSISAFFIGIPDLDMTAFRSMGIQLDV